MSGSWGISTSNSHIVGSVYWEERNVNNSANTSDVYVEMRMWRNNTGYTSYGSDYFYVDVNGSRVGATVSYSLTYNSNTLLVSGTVGVTHNSDGTKTISIGWGGGGGSGGVFTVNGGSGSATLTTIPRASTVSSSISWTAGTQDLPINLNVASSSFHHSIQIFVADTSGVYGNAIGQRDNIGTSTTWQFTQAEITTIYSRNNMYENRPVIVRVFTYDQYGTQIGGYQDATGTVYAVPTANATINGNNSFNIGTSIPYALNNYTTGTSGGFTYDFILTFGSFSKTISNVTAQSGNLTLTTTDVTNLYNATPNANSISGTVTVRTKYNGVYTEDGIPSTHDTSVTAIVASGSSNPTFTSAGVTYYDDNTQNGTTAITGNSAYIVQNQSNVTVKIPLANKAVSKNGATMSTYSATLNGVTKTVAYSGTADVTINFGLVSASANTTLTVTAIDSRGNSTSASTTVNMLSYQPPVVSARATRTNNFEAETTITLSGSISRLTISSVDKNTMTSGQLQYRYKDSSTSTWSAWTNFTFTLTTGNYTATNVVLTLDNVKSWDIQIQAIDKLETTTVSLSVGTGQPILFIDSAKKSIGVNQFPSGNGTFEVTGDLITTGNLTVNSKTYVSEKVTSIPATAGWYRIAQSPNGIANVMGTFEIQSAQSSHHSFTKLIAGINYGDADASLVQISHSNYGSPTNSAITQARIVYNTTYSGNYAYLEVYSPNATAYAMTVKLIGGYGWSLITAVAGSVPTGYTSESITFNSGGISTLGDITANGGNKLVQLTSNNSTTTKNGVDWNTITDTGFYNVNLGANAPIQSSGNPDHWFHVMVMKRQDPSDGSGYWIIQTAWDFRDGIYHRRSWINNGVQTWDKWRRLGDDRRYILYADGGGQGMPAGSWVRATWNSPWNIEGFIWQPGGNANMFGVLEEGWYEAYYSIYINQSVGTGYYAEVWGNANATNILSTWTPANGWNWLVASAPVYLYPNVNYEIVIKQTDGGYTRSPGEHRMVIKRI